MPIVITPPGPPGPASQALTTVTIWDYMYGPDGKPVTGELIELMPGWVMAVSISPVTVIEPRKIKADAVTDSNGYWQCQGVVPVDLLTIRSGDATYTVKDSINGDYRIKPLTTSASYQANTLWIP